MNYLKNRRERLLKMMEKDSIILLYSGKEIRQSGDNNYDFCVNRNFFYLTNISQANCYYLLDKKSKKSYLFIDEFDEKKEKWFGKKLTKNEAKQLSNIDNIYYTKDLKKELIEKSKIVYLDCNANEFNEIRNKYKIKSLKDANNIITPLRMIKDESEINDIKEAIKITHLGLNKIIKTLKTAKYEYEVFNAFNHEILNHGTHELGFPSIIASGVHTCCLHYPTPFDKLAKDGLLLCDVGAGYHHYSSDVTRTYPISGKFTPFQKKIYEIVLGANKEVIKHIKPGVSLKDLQEICKKYLAKQLLKSKLIKKEEDLINYYFHSVSHSLGLDTHDVGGREITLKEGMIITVEPGLYIKEKKTGVRIEDDVLVTKNSHQVLTIKIPKEIKDIEKLF